MNNPNPFVPQGSLQDLQNKRRKHMKIGVLCVLTVSVAGLMVMLIQGCKQKTADAPIDTSMPAPDTNITTAPETSPQPADTNVAAMTPPTNIVTGMNPNTPPPSPINTAPQPPVQQMAQMPPQPQQITTLPPVTTPPPEVGGGEYTVAKGDSLAKIAKKNGVSLKALVAANPDAKPTKLKIGQKLVIPAGGKTTVAEATLTPGADATDTSSETYIVKSGDTLTKIAKAHHVKVKALMAANHLTTAQIKVGKKLRIPGKAGTAPVPVATEPVATPPVDMNTQAPPIPQPQPMSTAPGSH